MELNVHHIRERLDRVPASSRQLIRVLMIKVARLAKAKRLPNSDWYITGYANNKAQFHICGRGVLVATGLAGNMIPTGTRIR